MAEPQWLLWARELQAIAQCGLTYCRDPYDRERYERARAIAAEIMAAGADAPLERVAGLFAEEVGYATPKVDVRGAVIRDGTILLVREASDGLWALPGGWADVTQAPREAVVRELREETGFETRPVKLAAVLDRARQGHPPDALAVYKLMFLCEIVGGEARPSHETPELGFFAPDALPPLSPPRTLPGQIERLFAHHADPSLATEFD